jgi:leucyl-tRNA synthetase
MLAPLCPHLGEEIWNRLGNAATITHEPFPEADPTLLVSDSVEIPVQVGGKVRSKVTVAADADEAAVLAAAVADERISQLIEGRTIAKTVVVPGRMVNLVLD